MADPVLVDADRLAALERLEAAASAWLRAWVSAQSMTSVTGNETAQAFDASKQLAETVRATAGR